MQDAPGEPSIHACCMVVREAGVLVRGPSGAGKSAFCASLIERANAQDLFARLVSDDRVRLAVLNDRLVACAPHTIAGLIERRGVGVMYAPHLPSVVVRLVVDIEEAPDRMPHEAGLVCDINGLRLPRLAVARGDPEAPGLALLRLAPPEEPPRRVTGWLLR